MEAFGPLPGYLIHTLSISLIIYHNYHNTIPVPHRKNRMPVTQRPIQDYDGTTTHVPHTGKELQAGEVLSIMISEKFLFYVYTPEIFISWKFMYRIIYQKLLCKKWIGAIFCPFIYPYYLFIPNKK